MGFFIGTAGYGVVKRYTGPWLGRPHPGKDGLRSAHTSFVQGMSASLPVNHSNFLNQMISGFACRAGALMPGLLSAYELLSLHVVSNAFSTEYVQDVTGIQRGCGVSFSGMIVAPGRMCSEA